MHADKVQHCSFSLWQKKDWVNDIEAILNIKNCLSWLITEVFLWLFLFVLITRKLSLIVKSGLSWIFIYSNELAESFYFTNISVICAREKKLWYKILCFLPLEPWKKGFSVFFPQNMDGQLNAGYKRTDTSQEIRIKEKMTSWQRNVAN